MGGQYVTGPGHRGSRCIGVQGHPHSVCTMAQGEGRPYVLMYLNGWGNQPLTWNNA